MDVGSIPTILAGLKNATDLLKLISSSSSTLEEAEVKLKIADIFGNLADARVEIADIKLLLNEKDQKIKQLEEELRVDKEIIWHDPYYLKMNSAGKKDGPYCQSCFDKDKKLIRLQSFYKNGAWDCKVCKTTYLDEKWHRLDDNAELPQDIEIDL